MATTKTKRKIKGTNKKKISTKKPSKKSFTYSSNMSLQPGARGNFTNCGGPIITNGGGGMPTISS